jgi:Leucine-rich repeat (LRR) protein
MVPAELGYCLMLENVDFSRNGIRTLPDIFAAFSKLIHFSINENELVGFPGSFANLKALKYLSFFKNQVVNMDSLVGLQTLINLDGRSNAIEFMDPIFLCNALEIVYLSENNIKSVSEDFQAMTCLQVLDLRKNFLEILPSNLALLTRLKCLDLRENYLSSLLPPAIFSCHVNGPVLRRYLKIISEVKDCLCLDLTFFDYREIPKFALNWTTKRQKARNRWLWAISKAKSIVKKSLASTLDVSIAEMKAAEVMQDDATKILGVQQTRANIALEKKTFDPNQLDCSLDAYYGRKFEYSLPRILRIPWQQTNDFDRARIEAENPELVPILQNSSLTGVEKFEQIVDTMLLQNPFFLSMIEFSWYYSNQKIPDGGKMTTQGPLRIHGIVILWLRDVLDLNSYVWADIIDGNDAVLLYEWTKLSDLPFFAQFLLLTTKCLRIITCLALLPAEDVLNQMAIALLKHHKDIIKKRAYKDAYTSAIEIGVADIQLVLMDHEEVIKKYGKPLMLAEGIEEDWEAVVGLEERTAFLRTDESAVVAYSKFQEEFFLLRVLIATDDFTPLPKYRQFSFVSESTRLYMFGNRLHQINPLISCLHALVEVNFSGNELADLPPMLRHLAQLQHLQLSKNRFQFFPEVLAQLGPNLVSLTLAWNSIKVIPPMVCDFSRIEELNLSYNMITQAQNLVRLHKLTTLHLASNNIARMISLARMSSLTCLTLNHNPINLFPASFGNGNDQLKVMTIDSMTRASLPPCYMNLDFWFFTPPSSEEVFERPL